MEEKESGLECPIHVPCHRWAGTAGTKFVVICRSTARPGRRPVCILWHGGCKRRLIVPVSVLDLGRSISYPDRMNSFVSLVKKSLTPFVAYSVVIVGLLAPRPALAEVKIAVIDVQRAIVQTEDGLRAQATLKKVFDSRQQELNKKQVELQKQKEEIDKQSKVLSKDALQKRVDEWQKQMMELQQVFVEYNKELDKKQKELTDPVIEKVMAIVKRIATTESIDVVLEKQTTAYVRADLDLTDRAIQMYNGGASGAAPAPKK